MPKSLRERTIAWALQSESAQRIRACLEIARCLPPIADNGEGWDAVPHKLGCSGGVYNLRRGALEHGVKEDKISRSTRVAYDAGAEAPRWRRFLDEVFVVPELVNYVQLAAGYSFTGEISEHCFFLCHGDGANGKSTFLGALKHIAGAYGYTLPFAVLEPCRNAGEGASPYMADLDGARFVTASEVRENTKLDESRIKTLSGEYDITARRLHGAPFTYRPQLKLWIGVNHKPRVADDSDGFWRRPRYIPFVEKFEGLKRDTRLYDTLLAETPGILRWVCEGATRWYAALDANDGRPVLDVVPGAEALLQEWRGESDPVQEFINDRCVEGYEFRVERGELYAEYDRWCADNHIPYKERLTRRSFIIRLTARYDNSKIGGRRFLNGIGIVDTNAPASL